MTPETIEDVWSKCLFRGVTLADILKHPPVPVPALPGKPIQSPSQRAHDLGRIRFFYNELAVGKVVTIPISSVGTLPDGNHRFAAAYLAHAKFRASKDGYIAYL